MQTPNQLDSLDTVFHSLADVGWSGDAADQGRDCLAYTENEDKAHEVFQDNAKKLQEVAEKAGMQLEIKTDPFGNSYAILHGESDRQILIGSHLDSVPHGGQFDGVLGVAVGLDILRRYIESGEKPKKTLNVIAYRAEESSVTGYSCLGSSLATGNYDVGTLKKRQHAVYQKSLFEVLGERGLSEEELTHLQYDPSIAADKVDAVLEVHIEQSSVLETLKEPVGVVVKGVGGARRSDVFFSSREPVEEKEVQGRKLSIVVTGKAGHSGGLPMNGEVILDTEMDLRKDALLAVAQFVLKLPEQEQVINLRVPGGGNYNTVQPECVLEMMVPEGFDIEEWKRLMDESLREGMNADFQLGDHEVISTRVDNSVLHSSLETIQQIGHIAEEMAKKYQGAVRATVGKFILEEDGTVVLGIDQRRLDNDIAEKMEVRFLEVLIETSQKYKVNMREENMVESLATPLSSRIADIMRETFFDLFKKKPVEMGSMPGQDIAKIIRTKGGGDGLLEGGMFFVRSLNEGVSHNPKELTSMEDIKKSSDLLFEVTKKL